MLLTSWAEVWGMRCAWPWEHDTSDVSLYLWLSTTSHLLWQWLMRRNKSGVVRVAFKAKPFSEPRNKRMSQNQAFKHRQRFSPCPLSPFVVEGSLTLERNRVHTGGVLVQMWVCAGACVVWRSVFDFNSYRQVWHFMMSRCCLRLMQLFDDSVALACPCLPVWPPTALSHQVPDIWRYLWAITDK